MYKGDKNAVGCPFYNNPFSQLVVFKPFDNPGKRPLDSKPDTSSSVRSMKNPRVVKVDDVFDVFLNAEYLFPKILKKMAKDLGSSYELKQTLSNNPGKHMRNSKDTREIHVLLPGETAAQSIGRNVGRMFKIFHVSQK
jgi:hypothetical protein